MISAVVGRCPPVPVLPHSSASSTNASDESVVTLTADDGYVFDDNSKMATIVCRERKWVMTVNYTKS